MAAITDGVINDELKVLIKAGALVVAAIALAKVIEYVIAL